MCKLLVKFNTVDQVKDFVQTVSGFEENFDLVAGHGRYIVDAKSILGIFSLDLSQPVTLVSKDFPQDIAELAFRKHM